MMEEKRFVTKPMREASHNVIMESRKKMSVSGVEDVESFDEEEVVLLTQLGTMTVSGSGLHIQKLSVETGEIVVEGTVDSIVYSDTEKYKDKGSLLSRLFK